MRFCKGKRVPTKTGVPPMISGLEWIIPWNSSTFIERILTDRTSRRNNQSVTPRATNGCHGSAATTDPNFGTSLPTLHTVGVACGRGGEPTGRLNRRDRAEAVRDVGHMESVLIPAATHLADGTVEDANTSLGPEEWIVVRSNDHYSLTGPTDAHGPLN